MRIRRPSICCKMSFSDYKIWEKVFGQDQRLPSFRKKPNKLVPVNSDLDANSNLATANDSWEWSIGKSLDETEKVRVISCLKNHRSSP